MALKNLSKRIVGNGFEYTEVIATGATGNTVLIPPFEKGNNLTCRIICGAGTGKIQTTTSLDASVVAGTETWDDHPDGNQTGTFSDVLTGQVTGIRAVSISGEITLEVLL